jgi:hypothetical protein
MDRYADRREPHRQWSHLEAHLLDIPEQHEPGKGLSALAAYARLEAAEAPVSRSQAAK